VFGIGPMNDDRRFTHADVLCCYDAAIAMAEAAESRREIPPG